MRREFGWPLAELGNIRLRRGDLAGAEEAFLAAHSHAWSPQPGLALLRLAQGDTAGAAALIADAIAHPIDIPSKERPPFGDLRLAPLLDAQTEIAFAASDIDTAERAGCALRTDRGLLSEPFPRCLRRTRRCPCGSHAARSPSGDPLRVRCDGSVGGDRGAVRGGVRPDGARRCVDAGRQARSGRHGVAGRSRRVRRIRSDAAGRAGGSPRSRRSAGPIEDRGPTSLRPSSGAMATPGP